MQLFANQTADGTSADFKHFGGATGLMNVYVVGALGGATLTVRAEDPGETGYIPLAGGAITEPGMHVVSAAPFVGQVALTGATASTDVSVWVEAEAARVQQRVREDS